MKEKNNILRDKLASIDHQLPTADLWSRLEKELPEPKPKRRYMFWLVLLGLVAGMGSWLVFQPANVPSAASVATEQRLSMATNEVVTATPQQQREAAASNSIATTIDLGTVVSAPSDREISAPQTPESKSAYTKHASITVDKSPVELANTIAADQEELKTITRNALPIAANHTIDQSTIQEQESASKPANLIDNSKRLNRYWNSSTIKQDGSSTHQALQSVQPIETVPVAALSQEKRSLPSIATSDQPALILPVTRRSSWSLDVAAAYGKNLDNPVQGGLDTTATFQHLDVWSAGIGINYTIHQRYGVRAAVNYSLLTDVNKAELGGADDYNALADGAFEAIETINRYNVYDKYASVGLSLSGYYEQPLGGGWSLRPEAGIRYQRLLTSLDTQTVPQDRKVAPEGVSQFDLAKSQGGIRTNSLGLQAGLHLYYNLGSRARISVGAVYVDQGLLINQERVQNLPEFRRYYRTLSAEARLTYRF